jgi:hypothetical protein
MLIRRRGMGDVLVIDPSLIASMVGGGDPSLSVGMTPNANYDPNARTDLSMWLRDFAPVPASQAAMDAEAARFAGSVIPPSRPSGGFPSWLAPAAIAVVIGTLVFSSGGGRRR